MCLWLLTACLGLLPSNPSSNIVVVQGVPSPIVLPTTTATTVSSVTPMTLPTIPTMFPTMLLPTIGPMPMGPTVSVPLPTVGATGGVTLPVLICNNSDVICVANPDEIDTGSLAIDPRLGTTASPLAALQVPLITGYNGQAPSFDTAVIFPREKRSLSKISVWFNNLRLNELYKPSDVTNKKHKIAKRQSCMCVASGTCIRTGTNAGAGMIDFRIVTPGGGSTGQCPVGQEYCCTGTTAQIACGTLQAVPAVAIAPAAGQANFGEYPWQALVLTKQNAYIGGGVLIDQRHVLTVTHRLSSYVVSGTAPNVKVRLGEWDAAGTYEPVPFQEYTIQRVFTHPSYNPNTLQYDITVLRLATMVPLSPAAGSAVTINRACLPPSSTSTYVGQRCWVSGWGKNMFGLQGQYQQILKKVDVPIVASGTCQTQMQTARLSASFVLDTTSFICAGGEANKDSCTGDGGSGLVCSVNGQWVLVGLVAWGLGCANANVPAAYVNIAALLPWIQQQVATP